MDFVETWCYLSDCFRKIFIAIVAAISILSSFLRHGTVYLISEATTNIVVCDNI